MEAGRFRYDLSEVRTKLIEGPHKYVGLVSLLIYLPTIFVTTSCQLLQQLI